MKSRCKQVLGPFLLALALGFLAAPPVAAQFDRDREAVRAELERTDRALERAWDHLQENPCLRGRALYDDARQSQREARGQYLANTVLGNRQALLLTRRAQQRVAEAVRSCQIDFKAHEVVRDLIRSTRELALGASPEIRASGDLEAARLLDAGLAQLDKAQEAYQDEQFRRSVRLASVARNLVQRAIQKSRGGAGSVTHADRVPAALERSDLLIGEVRVALALEENSKAQALLERAERQQTRARDLLRDGHPQMALRATTEARDLALEAHWALQKAPERDQVEAAIEVVQQMLEDLTPEIRARGPEAARTLLDKAGEQMREARSALQSGEVSEAAHRIRTAGSLLRRASEKAGLR